ncbi:MAG: LapA family protein [Pseudomonadota bacterium]
MRTVKLVVLAIVLLALMLVISANMGPVDLRMLPPALGVDLFSIQGVPLSFVIVIAVMFGFLIGLLTEFLREGKHRANLARKRRELSTLRDENARLASKIDEKGDDLAILPG